MPLTLLRGGIQQGEGVMPSPSLTLGSIDRFFLFDNSLLLDPILSGEQKG
jgi:hypothetical protein